MATTLRTSGVTMGSSTTDVTGTAPGAVARAWVNFNGTGTVAIRSSGNVSSITDRGVGLYTINFSTAMSDANHSFVGTTADVVGSYGGYLVIQWSFSYATSSVAFYVGRNGDSGATTGGYDSVACDGIIFR